MANLGPMFFSSYESISKHMEIYEQKLIQKEGEKRGNLKFALCINWAFTLILLARSFSFLTLDLLNLALILKFSQKLLLI